MIVPISQSLDYVAAATAAGAQATMVEVAGDHFVVIDPTTDAWRLYARDPRRDRLSQAGGSTTSATSWCVIVDSPSRYFASSG